jgi:hypothetical protein
MSTEHQNVQQDCPIFLLSKELRDEIYKLAFTPTIDETRSTNDDELIDLTRAIAIAPSNALMASCSRLYHDAATIYVAARRQFWSENRFVIPMEANNSAAASSPAADLKLLRLGFKHFELLKHVTIRVSGADFTHEHHLGPNPNLFVGICIRGFKFTSSSSLDPVKLQHKEDVEKMAVIEAVAGVFRARASAVQVKIGRGRQYMATTKQYLGYVVRERELNGNEKGLMGRCEVAEEELVDKAVEEGVLMKKAVLEGVVEHFVARQNARIRQV